ncbi:hypothetical protein KR009_003234 [Drosophila setifemur]|nr:hypothetical protein KR009_003234 [Drosophila setifemur]
MDQTAMTSSRLRWICACGLAISLYSLYVKFKLGENENYRPMCDVGDNVSCSLVFKSQYGDGFGLSTKIFGRQMPKLNPPNGAFGCAFYLMYFLSSFFEQRWLCLAQLVVCSLALLLCVYLGFLLVFVFYNCCVVCLTIYIIQSWLFLEVFSRYRRLYL